MTWPGADISVSPSVQTHGSYQAGNTRWTSFLHHKFARYDKTRNDIQYLHNVLQTSCYLNLGIVSIFDIIHDVWQASTAPPNAKRTYSANDRNWYKKKFLDEIVKWRKIGYTHSFAYPTSFPLKDVILPWATKYFASIPSNNHKGCTYTLHQLESGSTHDEKWKAMQHYLVETGELQNNARMTWGKTVVHWLTHTETNNNNSPVSTINM